MGADGILTIHALVPAPNIYGANTSIAYKSWRDLNLIIAAYSYILAHICAKC